MELRLQMAKESLAAKLQLIDLEVRSMATKFDRTLKM